MNKKMYRTGIELINVLMPLLVIYSLLICFLYYQYGNLNVVLYTIAFMTVPIIFFITYRAIDNMFLFTLIHMIMIAAVFFFSPNMLYKVLFGILSIIFAIFSYYKKNDVVLPKPSSIGFIPTIAMVVTFFISKQYDSIFISALITLAFIIYVLLCMYNKYLVNTFIFCNTTNSTDIKSFSKSQTTLKKMWGLFIFASTAVMALFSLIPSTPLLHYLKVGFVALFRLILSPLGNPDPDFLKMEEPPESVATPSPDSTLEVTGAQSGSTHFSMLPIYIIFGIALIFVSISLIRSILATRNDEKKKKQEDDEDEVSYISRDKKKDVKKSKRFAGIFGNSTEQKIRKIFYKTITDNIDERLNVRGSLTPTQLCNITYEEVDKDTLHSMKDIYLQARYSDEPSSHKDLVHMKELAKKCQHDVKESYEKYDKLDTYGSDKGVGGR